MDRIKLDIYKNNSIYFYLFDKLIKDNYPNKEEFLTSIDIAPSTYRRCRLNSSSISNEILHKLCNKLEINSISDNEIDELELYVNELFKNIYYKVDVDFDKELEYIKNKIELNQVTYPIYKLLELFIHSSKGLSPFGLIENYSSSYNELIKYKKMFNTDLYLIYELIELIFKKDIDDNLEFKNVICYQILATRAYSNKKFIESLYYCNIAKDCLIENLNFSRIYSINSIIFNNYVALGKYDDAYNLALNQLNSVNANISKNKLYDYSNANYILICYLMNKYNEAIKILNTYTKLSNTMLTILILINRSLKLEVNLEKYTFNENLYLELVKFKKIDKSNCLFLEKYNINSNLLNYFKKI